MHIHIHTHTHTHTHTCIYTSCSSVYFADAVVAPRSLGLRAESPETTPSSHTAIFHTKNYQTKNL